MLIPVQRISVGLLLRTDLRGCNIDNVCALAYDRFKMTLLCAAALEVLLVMSVLLT